MKTTNGADVQDGDYSSIEKRNSYFSSKGFDQGWCLKTMNQSWPCLGFESRSFIGFSHAEFEHRPSSMLHV